MIENSFIFLDGIREKTEQNIWNQGIYNWDSFIQAKAVKGIGNTRKCYYDRQLEQARKELHDYGFLNRFPLCETWRIYDYLKDECVFLDIETSGIGKHCDITVVGLFDGIETKSMIAGINLDLRALKRELERYKMIVTFNGAAFDIPFIKKRYPSLLPEVPHLDLRFACEKAGLSGGLKKIEKELGIARNKLIDDLYGGDPYLLWRMFRGSGDEHYLNLLVEYNEDDVFNLKKIADYACDKLKSDILKTMYEP
ncbi:MAG TPA: ribonuclease H-like domain-containing protein [Candidatus Nanoarchaeia archaeon]|nr:ribonuclease H-like domain-containing protein [Candidatus Nanoarchaeia archaeon]